MSTIHPSAVPFFTSIRYGLPESQIPRQKTLIEGIFQGIEGYFPSKHCAYIYQLNDQKQKIATIEIRKEQPSFYTKISYFTVIIPLIVAIAKLFARAIYHLHAWAEGKAVLVTAPPSVPNRADQEERPLVTHAEQTTSQLQLDQGETEPVSQRQETSALQETDIPSHAIPPFKRREHEMQIFVKALDGYTYTVEVDTDELCSVLPARLILKNIKRRAEGSSLSPFAWNFKNLLLIHSGKALPPSQTIASQKLNQAGSIHCIFRSFSSPNPSLPWFENSSELQELVDRADALCMNTFLGKFEEEHSANLIEIESNAISAQLEAWKKRLDSPAFVESIEKQDEEGRKLSESLLYRYKFCIPSLIATLRMLQPDAHEEAQRLRSIFDPLFPLDLTNLVLSYLPAPAPEEL